jgi:acyl dehydratase
MAVAKWTPADLAARVGQELGVSEWITLDQARIDAFAACTGDRQWIHVDVERAARESPFGGPVAHGHLTLSLVAPTALELVAGRVAVRQALNYGLDKVRFLAPVRAGRRVRNRIAVVAVEDKGDGRFLLTTENTIEIEGERKPALVATALALLME